MVFKTVVNNPETPMKHFKQITDSYFHKIHIFSKFKRLLTQQCGKLT